MKGPIVLVDADEGQCQYLSALLERKQYHIIPLDSLERLEKKVHETSCRVLILDLDNLSVDDRFIRNIKNQNRRSDIIVLSSRCYHPELKEALGHYIYACLIKPVDIDELLYILRSIYENESSSETFDGA